jgi:hypothetical protein
MATTTTPKRTCYKNLDEKDKLEFAITLYRWKFLNEYYRARSLDLIHKLTPYSVKLAGMGFYYAGKSTAVNRRKCQVEIVCIFCDFKHELHIYTDEVDLAVIETMHAVARNEICSDKTGNVPFRKQYRDTNIKFPSSNSLFPFPAMSADIEESLLTISELKDRNSRALSCLICRLRPMACIFLPCSHILYCGVCIAEVSHEYCPRCTKKIVAYSKIYIN